MDVADEGAVSEAFSETLSAYLGELMDVSQMLALASVIHFMSRISNLGGECMR